MSDSWLNIDGYIHMTTDFDDCNEKALAKWVNFELGKLLKGHDQNVNFEVFKSNFCRCSNSRSYIIFFSGGANYIDGNGFDEIKKIAYILDVFYQHKFDLVFRIDDVRLNCSTSSWDNSCAKTDGDYSIEPVVDSRGYGYHVKACKKKITQLFSKSFKKGEQ